MNEYEQINKFLIFAGVYGLLYISERKKINFYIENTDNSKIVSLDLSIRQSIHIKRNKDEFIECLEEVLYNFNNYSFKTFKNVGFGIFILNGVKYGNTIYLYNGKTDILGYKEMNSIGMNKDIYGNILNLYRIEHSQLNTKKDNIKSKKIENINEIDRKIIQENYNIIYEIIDNEDLSVRNLMKYFNQPISNKIFNILKENGVFEIDKINHSKKTYFLDKLKYMK